MCLMAHERRATLSGNKIALPEKELRNHHDFFVAPSRCISEYSFVVAPRTRAIPKLQYVAVFVQTGSVGGAKNVSGLSKVPKIRMPLLL